MSRLLASVGAAAALSLLAPAALAEGKAPRADVKPEPDFTWVFIDAHARVSALLRSGGDGGKPLLGTTVGTTMDWVVPSGLLNSRAGASLGIGGGGGGVEGVAALSAAYGVRAPFGKHHGPIARAAAALRYGGNDNLLGSYVQLPQGQLGYQLTTEEFFFELGGTAAQVLAGRFNAGEQATRSLDDSFGWGGFFAASLRGFPGGLRDFAGYAGFRFDAEFLRVEATSAPRTPVDQLRARLCGATFVTVCADLSWFRGDQELQGGAFRDTTLVQAGVSLGLGAAFADVYK